MIFGEDSVQDSSFHIASSENLYEFKSIDKSRLSLCKAYVELMSFFRLFV